MNTVVTRGRAELVITATGMATEMGRLAGMLARTEDAPTSVQIQLDGLGKHLAAIAGVMVTVIFLASLLRGEPLASIILTSIALAVAATLTLSQMTGQRVWSRHCHAHVSGQGYELEGEIHAENGAELPDVKPLLEVAALCNDSYLRAGQVIGDPRRASKSRWIEVIGGQPPMFPPQGAAHQGIGSHAQGAPPVCRWTPQRPVRWAAQTGPATARVVETILAHRPHLQQGFRSCLGILRLDTGYGATRSNRPTHPPAF